MACAALLARLSDLSGGFELQIFAQDGPPQGQQGRFEVGEIQNEVAGVCQPEHAYAEPQVGTYRNAAKPLSFAWCEEGCSA